MIFQRLLNSLLNGVKWREHGHINPDRRAGLLGSSEQGDLTTHVAGNLPECWAIREGRPNPALRAMPFNEGGRGVSGQRQSWCCLGH